MKRLKPYYYWLIAFGVVAIGHQVLQKYYGIQLPWLHAYLDDLLAMPLILGLWRWERNLWWQEGTLRKRDIAGLTIVTFILFEFVLPSYSTAFTADWYDGLAYSGGSILFWWIQAS